MEERERNRLEAELKKMLNHLAEVEEWEKEREAKEKLPVTGPKIGNMIRRRKGKKDKRLMANDDAKF